MYSSGIMRVFACCCTEEATVVSGDSDETFAASSGSFTADVSHKEAGTCGVAIDDIFILQAKKIPQK
jgi:hypothetical protein